RSTSLKYSNDFSATGNIYEKMVQQNIIAPVIEQKSFIGSTPTLLSTVRTNYRDWKNDKKVIAPEIVQASLYNNPLEPRLQFNNYDISGNVLSVNKASDALECYIYDYNSSYPIAVVKNAGSSEIAYTSFEADGTGNWDSYTGTITFAVPPAFAPTGNK